MSAPILPTSSHPDSVQPLSEERPLLPVCSLFGLDILALSFEQAAAALEARAASRARPTCVVVTPNVDHLTRLDRATPEFRSLYASADAIFADGMPLVWASKHFGDTPLPGRVTGADLFVTLARWAGERGFPIFVLGGQPGEEADLSASLAARFPGLKAEVFSPSMQFDPDGAEGREALRRVALTRPAIVFACLGMPKQERWALGHRDEIDASVVMCVGAALEFALGQKRRAPAWMQSMGFEWLWRLLSEPRRLWRRYLVQSLRFARLLRHERAASLQKRQAGRS